MPSFYSPRDQAPPLEPEALRARLPQVGDRRLEHPTALGDGVAAFQERLWGQVVYVNRAHLFYTVRFDSGLLESYKAP